MERTQAFEGVCLRRHNAGVTSTFTVRKISNGIGVERIFPLHSPVIESVSASRWSRRQSRIYYSERFGRAVRSKSAASTSSVGSGGPRLSVQPKWVNLSSPAMREVGFTLALRLCC